MFERLAEVFNYFEIIDLVPAEPQLLECIFLRFEALKRCQIVEDEVKKLQLLEVAEPAQIRDLVVVQSEFLQLLQMIDALDGLQLVRAKVQQSQVDEWFEILDFADPVALQEKLLEVDEPIEGA